MQLVLCDRPPSKQLVQDKAIAVPSPLEYKSPLVSKPSRLVHANPFKRDGRQAGTRQKRLPTIDNDNDDAAMDICEAAPDGLDDLQGDSMDVKKSLPHYRDVINQHAAESYLS